MVYPGPHDDTMSLLLKSRFHLGALSDPTVLKQRDSDITQNCHCGMNSER